MEKPRKKQRDFPTDNTTDYYYFYFLGLDRGVLIEGAMAGGVVNPEVRDYTTECHEMEICSLRIAGMMIKWN